MHFLVLLSALVACAADVPFNTTNSALDGRRVCGKPVEIERYPHQVALLYDGSFICGGSIISRKFVVTAASCFAGVNTDYLKVTVGSTHYTFNETIHRVIQGYIPDSYIPESGDYNVGVLQVDPPFTYSNRVRYIKLERSEVRAGSSVVVTGWGSTGMENPSSIRLREAIVEIRDRVRCPGYDSGVFTDRMMCAKAPCRCKGPCNEDTGGPLTTIYCPRTLVGIVSYRLGECWHANYPTVYTRVSAVYDWIKQFAPEGETNPGEML